MESQLSNPVWASLTTAEAAFAQHLGGAVRYEPDIAPFAAIDDPDQPIDVDLLLQHGDVYFAGVLPRLRPGACRADEGVGLQMVFRGQPPASGVSTANFVAEELTAVNGQEMVELTQVAFPGFFRVRTPLLGRYLGVRVDGQLVAMAGERMRWPGMVEISGVCTRPGFTGRGYATHLIRRLLEPRSGERPFLHVASSNARAIALYRSLGFELHGPIKVMHLSRL